MQRPISWHTDALRLRAQGHDTGQIAAALGQAPEAVRQALLGTPRSPAGTLGAGSLIEPHTPRIIRTVLDKQALPSAAADFAAGRIDRAELLRRISR